jgi:hypothetical protein
MVCTNHPIASAAGVEMFAVVSHRRELRQSASLRAPAI